MQSAEPSMTAKIAAVARGRHRLLDARPWIFDDPYALSLVGRDWPAVMTEMTTRFSARVLRQLTGGMVNRARYTEDRLLYGEFTQYVVLGAGFESFAWRRPDLLSRMRVFEIDHPATQRWKRQRSAELALPEHENHVFVPVDFETETLRQGLDAAGFDWSGQTLFSLLGVVQYLTEDAVQATLDTIASCAAGSEVVLTYTPSREYLDDTGRELADSVSRVAGEQGEPVQTLLSPAEAEDLVERTGRLLVSDHPTREDAHKRYFADREDGLTPYTAQRLLAAVVRDRKPTA